MDIQVKNKSYSICIFLKELLIIFICTKGTRTFKNIVMDAFWGDHTKIYSRDREGNGKE